MSKKPRRVPRGPYRDGGGPDLEAMMRQAAHMQADLVENRVRLAEETYRGTAGGGVVTAVVRGDGEVVSVTIDPVVLDPEDAELVGDLVVAALNQALRAAGDAAGEAFAGGLDLESLRGLEGLSGLLG